MVILGPAQPARNGFWQLISRKLKQIEKTEKISDAHSHKLSLIKISTFFLTFRNFWHYSDFLCTGYLKNLRKL